VIKELTENALDAGAARVQVEIADGGRLLIKVADDGEGMDPDDARTAFARHATSKLSRAEELEAVGTYGFRGEALPSIGAVGRVRLVTCLRGAAEGAEVVYEGGRLVSAGPGPARAGTVVWVRDLFFNTPARRRAMRSAPAETARVSETLATLALACPDVSVSLSADGRRLWSTPGDGDLVGAVTALFGASFARRSVAVDRADGPPDDAVRVRGLIGLPDISRKDGRRQYLSVRGRPVLARLMRKAVEQAYGGLLQSGRTPVFVLDIELKADAVDVNIHPAKTFVRFRDYGRVHRAVFHALTEALDGADLFGGRLAAAARDGTSVRDPAARDSGRGPATHGATRPNGETLWSPRPVPQGSAGQAALWREQPAAAPAEGPAAADLAELEPLGQLAGLFIAARGRDGLYVIDQHAAHERILYERLLGVRRSGTETPGSQVLAVPETIDLAPGEEGLLEECLEPLGEMGFDIEPFGGRTVVVRAVPAVVAGAAPGRLVADLLERYRDETSRRGVSTDAGDPDRTGGTGGAGVRGEAGPPSGIDRVRVARAVAACRAAVKAGELLSIEEMRALLTDLAACEQPRTCPHGRPTVLRMSFEELRAEFGRE